MISLSHGLIFSVVLFFLGFFCLMSRKNFFFILIGLEIMLNAISLSIITISSFWNHPFSEGYLIYIVSIALGVCESSVGLVLLLQMYRNYHTLDIDKLREIEK